MCFDTSCSFWKCGRLTANAGIFLIALMIAIGAIARDVGSDEELVEPLKDGTLSAWRKPLGNWAMISEARLDDANPTRLRMISEPTSKPASATAPTNFQAASQLWNGVEGRAGNLLTTAEFHDPA
jgi:hypothetical protein